MPDYAHLLDIIRQENEFVTPDAGRVHKQLSHAAYRRRQRALEKEKRREEDRELSKKISQRKACAKYYRKNKERLNKERVKKNQDPYYQYYRAKKRAEYNGQAWEFSEGEKGFEEWCSLWSNAKEIRNESSGFMVPAWTMKGSNPFKNTQMKRRDTTKGWSVDNCFIGLNGEEL